MTANGSITAFYTVLLESDDEPDPVAEEIRSILDGHIYLSRKLAASGHFPAIDVLRSASRVAHQVTGPDVQQLAAIARKVLARIEQLQVLLDLGEYRPGENAANDQAMACREALMGWLCQDLSERCAPQAALESLHGLLG